MEHFNIIQALCRSALSTPNHAVVQQVNRLKEALKKMGMKRRLNQSNLYLCHQKNLLK